MIDRADDLPEWSDEERALLASAELDRVPRDALPRALRAATAAAVASSVAAPAAALTLGGKAGAGLGLVKWLAVAAVMGGAAAGVVEWQKARATRPSEGLPAVAPALPPRKPPVAAKPAVAAPAPAPAPAAPVVPAPEASAVPARRTPSHASARTDTSAVAQPDLTRDIAALDEARRALRAGRAGEALAALDRYDAEFGKSGALRVEARVLRIEATARAGDRARAETMARAFLAQNPNSPYAGRVRALLGP